MMLWMEDKCKELQTMPPPDQDASILNQQIKEHWVCVCVCVCVLCVCACAYTCISLSSSPFTLPCIFPFPLAYLSLISQAFFHEANAKYDTLLADGLNLLQLAHPNAVPVLQDKLHHLEQRLVDLCGRIGQPCHQAF